MQHLNYYTWFHDVTVYRSTCNSAFLPHLSPQRFVMATGVICPLWDLTGLARWIATGVLHSELALKTHSDPRRCKVVRSVRGFVSDLWQRRFPARLLGAPQIHQAKWVGCRAAVLRRSGEQQAAQVFFTFFGGWGAVGLHNYMWIWMSSVWLVLFYHYLHKPPHSVGLCLPLW